MFADVVHNIRTSLDHLTWAIACYESFTGIPINRRIAFPTWDRPPQPKDRHIIRELSEPVRTMIEHMQPYMRPATIYPLHLLSLLRDLDNGNKHQTIQLCFASAALARFQIKAAWQDATDVPRTGVYTGDIKDGTEVIVAMLNRPHPEMECEMPMLSVTLAIKHPAKSASGADRDDYAAFGDALIAEARFVIDEVSSAVAPIIVV